MNQQQQKLQPKVDIKQSTAVKSEDGGQIFQEAIILRQVSKFLVGSDENMLVPIPVFVDIKSGKIFIESLPKDLQAEYVEYNKSLSK